METDGPCVAIHGPDSVPGHIYLTKHRVFFEPTAAPQAPAVEAWVVDIGSIRSARMLDTGSTLLLDVADGQRRLTGPGAGFVHDRLIQLIAAINPSDPIPVERVLLQATTMVEVNSLLSATGQLTVTNLRIRFEPSRLESWVGLTVAFDDPIADLRGFGFTRFRRRLEVRSSSRTTWFIGDVTPALYGALQLCAEAKAGNIHAEAMDYGVIPASLCRGAVRHPGALVETATHLAFVATGALDALAGVEALSETPVAAITSIGLVGSLEPRIGVVTADGRATYVCRNANDRYEQLVAWLAARVPGPIWLGTGADPVPLEVEECLAPFRSSEALPAGPQLFTPAVGLGPNRLATPGFLLVGEDTMEWLPARAPSAATPRVVFQLGRERWIWSSDRDEVQVERGGAIFRWVTRSGKPFRLALFERVQQIKQRAALLWASSGAGVISEGQNRRDSYRVPVSTAAQPAFSISISIEAGSDFQSLSFEMVEVSLGGCSIRTQRELSSDLLPRLDLMRNERVYSVQTSVRYSRPHIDDQRWTSGLIFVDPTADFEDALRQFWMILQQDRIRMLRRD